MSKLLRGTIVAIATAVVPQQGSISIVRLSGDQALGIAQQIFLAPGAQLWDSHRILYGHIYHPQTKQVIDECLMLIMKAPRSYTREDVVEFHCHGGIIPVQQILNLTIELGARLAQPGEFTLRAFLRGRLDLTQAEAINQIVAAQSQQAAQIALAGLSGKLADLIHQLREDCLDVLAEIEARIDFEEDLPALDQDSIQQRLVATLGQMEEILATGPRGELLREGLKVAIVGQPNVGKSSLLNAWSQTDRAIVTDLPGTTRDVVESQLVVQGIPIQVLDTAGIRQSDELVEQIGIKRSLQVAHQADLVLLTIDAQQGWTTADQAIYDQIQPKPVLLVVNKIDLAPQSDFNYPSTITRRVETAAAWHQGIEDLEQGIVEFAQQGTVQAANLDFAINQRQAEALIRAKSALEQVEQTIASELPLDFWTIDLRTAIQALGEITGEEVTESVLDKIFSRFCIGK